MINIEKKIFGTYNGKDIYKYELTNNDCFQVNILNFGGIITEIYTKDKNGNCKNIVLGYNKLEDYIDNPSYAGAIIGRTAGRMEKALFSINGIMYDLYKNNGNNSIHGGKEGLNKRIFNVKELGNGIELFYKSPHMEEGYPGNVEFRILYLINENNQLTIEYNATTDRDTYINLTNHSYFNLSGELAENGDEQILKIDSDRICELRKDLIPTGNEIIVENTVFDLREGKKIKDGITKGHPQFDITRGYDHPFILNAEKMGINPQIELYSKYSGIKMKVYTTEKTVVVYSGNYLDEVLPFYSSKKIEKNDRFLGVAIETQDIPNCINQKLCNDKITKINRPYYSKTIYKFSVE